LRTTEFCFFVWEFGWENADAVKAKRPAAAIAVR
jgi:hypothetical protein